MNQISFKEFEAHLRELSLQPDSLRAYCADVRQYLEWLSTRGKDNLLAIGVEDAQEYVTFLDSPIHTLRPGKIGPYAASTIVRKIKTLRYFYDFLNTQINA